MHFMFQLNTQLNILAKNKFIKKTTKLNYKKLLPKELLNQNVLQLLE